MTRELNLSQLTTELTDFLGLPAELDLPPVTSVQCKRTEDTPWQVQAWVSGRDDVETYAHMLAWARYTGGDVVAEPKPYVSPSQPSGMQRTLRLTVVVDELPIELRAGVDALFVVPQNAEMVAS